MSQVNIQLLAKELGLSIGTVSKALRDSHEISIETKKLVSDLAQKLHYTPNPYASSLRRKKSNTVAVVIPEVADSFFSLAIKGIEEIAQQKDYHVLIYLTYESYEKEKKILEDFRNGRVDGVLMSAASGTNTIEHIEELQKSEVPIVFFDRSVALLKATKIITDDFDSSYNATKHLIEAGCKKVAYLSASDSALMNINNDRMAGFKKALEEAGMPFIDAQILQCPNAPDVTQTFIEAVLRTPQRPDAFLASVEQLAAPVYLSCKKLGIKIPETLKVICFSTTPYAAILEPGLTTVSQPAKEIGKVAATHLFKILGKKRATHLPETIVIPSTLQIRRSSV